LGIHLRVAVMQVSSVRWVGFRIGLQSQMANHPPAGFDAP